MKKLISKEYPLVVSGNTVNAIYYDLDTFLRALNQSLSIGNARYLMGVWVHGHIEKDTIAISEVDMKKRGLTLESSIREVLQSNPLSILIHFYIADNDQPGNSPAMEFNCFSGMPTNKIPLLGKIKYNN